VEKMTKKEKEVVRDYIKMQYDMAITEKARENAHGIVRIILNTPKAEEDKLYKLFIV
jgi:hypothetical protein